MLRSIYLIAQPPLLETEGNGPVSQPTRSPPPASQPVGQFLSSEHVLQRELQDSLITSALQSSENVAGQCPTGIHEVRVIQNVARVDAELHSLRFFDIERLR